MTSCKYNDCGFCYAPDDVETSASSQSACFDPDYCPFLKSQMTDLDIIKECRQTGRTRTTTKKLLEKAYETPMNKNQEEIEKVKAEIKVLEKKLSFLEEAEKTKTPCEEAYKRVYGNYPFTNIADTCWSGSTWTDFSTGYNAAQEDYKVGEYQETIPKEEPKTLYQIFRENDRSEAVSYVLCDIVKEWMFQYNCDNYEACREYLNGYQKCQTVLEEKLK